MNFQSILTDFQSASNGTDAFKQLKQQCESAILNPKNLHQYSALFLIYGFAKNYVLLYEDQAVSSSFALEAKMQLLDYMSRLNQALCQKDSQVLLDALNAVVHMYSQSTRLF